MIERTINNVQISSQIKTTNTTTQEEDDLFSSLLNPVEESNDQQRDTEEDGDKEELENDSSVESISENNNSVDTENVNIDTDDEIPKEEDAFNTIEPESNSIDNENSQEDSVELSDKDKNNLKGSIFDYIGDYDYEDNEIDVEDTNNYSPPEEQVLDITEVSESDIDIHQDIPDEHIIPIDKQDENHYEDYDLLDDVFLDSELEDIFFINEDDGKDDA